MPRKKTDMKRRTLFVSEAVWSRVENLAIAKGTGVSDLIRRAIIELLERLEENK